jgi:hypothetical protein
MKKLIAQVMGILTLCYAMPLCWAQNPNLSSGGTVPSGLVNTEFSRIYVHAFKTGFGHEHAVEGRLQQGHLVLNTLSEKSDEPGELVFDMKSFDADGPKARRYVGLEGVTDATTRAQVNENLLGKDVLDVNHFPTARFVVDQVVSLDTRDSEGRSMVRLTGDFTLHGIKRNISFDAVLGSEKGWHRLIGKFKILQSDYGIKPFSKAFGAVGVADELTIHGDLIVAP